jgi:hypothetical protein
LPASPDFPRRAADVADWVWLDWPAHFRPGWVALYRNHGFDRWLTRGRIEDEAARWRETLGDDRVKTGREWFSWQSRANDTTSPMRAPLRLAE